MWQGEDGYQPNLLCSNFVSLTVYQRIVKLYFLLICLCAAIFIVIHAAKKTRAKTPIKNLSQYGKLIIYSLISSNPSITISPIYSHFSLFLAISEMLYFLFIKSLFLKH